LVLNTSVAGPAEKGDAQVQEVVGGRDEAMPGLGMLHRRSLKFL